MSEVREIFSSIQGEGIYVGRRQIFVRFVKCNLNCDYCDTSHKIEAKFCTVNGKKKILKNANDVANEIKKLYTKDVFSISLTGGEPLIYTSLIRQIGNKTDVPLYLETNSTLPEKAEEIKDIITYASCGIKLNYPKFYNDSLKTIEILNYCLKSGNLFVKVVITKDVDVAQIEILARNLKNIGDNIPLVLQPQTGIKWDNSYKNTLLTMNETACNFLKDVRIIPQLHKFLGFE